MQECQASARTEQLEALRVQAGLQMQALVQLAGGGEATAARQNTPRIHLPKMTAEDDAQAFLEAFEVAAEACQWPTEEWGVRPLPLLSGEAQQAAYSLPPAAKIQYKNIRKAVLDRTGYSPEEQRRRFRNLVLAANDRPFAYSQRLADLARRWLQLEVQSAAGVCGTDSVGEVCGRAARSNRNLGALSSTLQPQCRRHPRRGPYGPLAGTTPRREAGASPTAEVPSSRGISCGGPGGNIYPS